MLGQKVVNLFEVQIQEGEYISQQWNGRDIRGNSMSNGMYLVQVQPGDRGMTEKVLLRRNRIRY